MRRLTVDDSVPALARDVADDRLQPAQIRLVERPAQPARARRADALHKEGYSKRVEPLADEIVDRGRRRPGIVLAKLARDDGVAELTAGLVHTEVGEFGARAWTERGGRCGRGRGRGRAAGLTLGVVYI